MVGLTAVMSILIFQREVSTCLPGCVCRDTYPSGGETGSVMAGELHIGQRWVNNFRTAGHSVVASAADMTPKTAFEVWPLCSRPKQRSPSTRSSLITPLASSRCK